MDYEKKYNEALERARNLMAMYPQDAPGYKEVFPELAESEDERIRKHLIAIVELYWGKTNDPDKAKDLAYLEKQKDASKAIEAVDRIDKYIDEHLANAHDMKDSNPDKKYYRGWDDALGKMAGILQDVYSEKQKEQKPAEWSEEDEEMIERLIRHTQEEFDELCNDRYGHQEIISDLKESCRERMNWLEKLKSLRPSWKPSKEQMEALEECGECKRCIKELYEQLKKLM